MMWSGHTVHTILPAYCILSALEREFEIVAWLTKREFICISVKMLLTWILGFIEAGFILSTHDHYSIDIWISLVLTSQVLSNQKLAYWAGRINPFIKHLDKPKTLYEKVLINRELMSKFLKRRSNHERLCEEDGHPLENTCEEGDSSEHLREDGYRSEHSPEDGGPSESHFPRNMLDDGLANI